MYPSTLPRASPVKVGLSVSTSFWHDNWTSFGSLATALPAVQSHRLAQDVKVYDVMSQGVGALLMRARLSPAAVAELDVVMDALACFVPRDTSDNRTLLWSSTDHVRTRDAYRLLHSTGCGSPLSDPN